MCERYTDTGSCRWDVDVEACVESGKKLPPGAFGVALVGLDPLSAPLELKPGPSTSSGNVSLLDMSFKMGDTLSFDADSGRTTQPLAPTSSPLPEGSQQDLSPMALPQDESFCNLGADTGRCRAAFRRWYWNAESGNCEEFVWGGCGGDANRFETQEECEEAGEKWCEDTRSGIVNIG